MSIHKDTKTNTWYFRKRIQQLDGSTKNCKRSGFKTKKEAQKAEIEFSFNDATTKLSISMLCNEYSNYRANKLKPSTLYSEKIIIKKYIIPDFGNRDSNGIKISDIVIWQKNLQNSNLSITRINKICLTFSLVLEFGKNFFNLRDNPVKKIGMIKDITVKEQKINVWTKEEFEKFISCVHSIQYKTLFYTLYYTGVRVGEAMALTFDDIDLDNKILRINKTLSFGNENVTGYAVTSPKTKNANRKIDLPLSLIKHLKLYLEDLKSNNIKYKRTDFLFGISKPLPSTTVTRIKNTACNNAEVKQIRIHDFRHTHASQLIEKGVDPIYVKERLGHEDISTTLNTYSHLFKNRRKSIIEMIEKL